MRTRFFILLLAISGMLACCPKVERVDPPKPASVAGWQEYKDRWLRIRGEFVLEKAQSSENGKIRVTILEIVPPDRCAEPGTLRRSPSARVRFSRLSDQSVLCEDTIYERQSGNLTRSCIDNLDALGITGFEVRGINVKDGWVFLRLFG